jgi:hypothetical protein
MDARYNLRVIGLPVWLFPWASYRTPANARSTRQIHDEASYGSNVRSVTLGAPTPG